MLAGVVIISKHLTKFMISQIVFSHPNVTISGPPAFFPQQKFGVRLMAFHLKRGQSSKRRRTMTSTIVHRPTVPFQAEPEEGLPIQAASSSSSKALFGPESEEAEDSPRTGASGRQTKRTGRFNFGWSKLHDATKARFNKQVAVIPKPPKKKRPYNNKSRAAKAAFARKYDVLKQNGRSSQRISSVLSLDECLCTCPEPYTNFPTVPDFFLLDYL